jgi:hypothetical protein
MAEEAIVLDCPARSAADDNLGDIVFRDGKAGHPGDGIFDLVLRIDNFDEISKPIQLTSIVFLPSRSGTASDRR